MTRGGKSELKDSSAKTIGLVALVLMGCVPPPGQPVAGWGGQPPSYPATAYSAGTTVLQSGPNSEFTVGSNVTLNLHTLKFYGAASNAA